MKVYLVGIFTYNISEIFSDVFLTFLPQAKYTKRPLKMYPST